MVQITEVYLTSLFKDAAPLAVIPAGIPAGIPVWMNMFIQTVIPAGIFFWSQPIR